MASHFSETQAKGLFAFGSLSRDHAQKNEESDGWICGKSVLSCIIWREQKWAKWNGGLTLIYILQ